VRQDSENPGEAMIIVVLLVLLGMLWPTKTEQPRRSWWPTLLVIALTLVTCASFFFVKEI
jgi:hypothetical protein